MLYEPRRRLDGAQFNLASCPVTCTWTNDFVFICISSTCEVAIMHTTLLRSPPVVTQYLVGTRAAPSPRCIKRKALHTQPVFPPSSI